MVVDRARFPRDKTCGDGLTTDALRRLEALGLDPAAVPSWTWVPSLTVRSPSGRAAELAFPPSGGRYAAVARRAELDAALLGLAREAGAAVLDGSACVGAEEREDRVVVSVDGVGEIHARYAVGADGAWSPLRRHLGLTEDGYRGEWHGLRQYLRGVTGPAAGDLHVWFEPDLLPAYAWSFPLGAGVVNAGFAYERATGPPLSTMSARWADVLARPHVRAALGAEVEAATAIRTWPIPARIHATRLTGRRVLFAGDAAAATDPVTGEGIGQALLTGVAAAESCLVAGPERAAFATRRHAATVRRALGPDHRLSRALLRIVRHAGGVRAGIRVADTSPSTRVAVAGWLFEARPRTRPWVGAGPGAYPPPRCRPA